MEITSNSIYAAAREFANTIAAQLNEQASEVAGVDVLWFRSVPQQRSTDVIFQTYTLHNVEECPIEIKALYTDSTYNDAELQFKMMGIEYKPTLCLEIASTLWYKATDNDGTLPQQHDIIFIPLTKKLWEVDTMTPVMQIGSVTTSFKCNLKTYTPRADRFIGDGLQEAIDNSTVDVDKLYGDDIINELTDLTDKNQLDKHSSTVKDKYKELTKVDVTDEHEILHRKGINYTIGENVMLDGHIVARSYYNMNIDCDIVTEYKNINDTILSVEERCLSLWVNPQYDENSTPITSIKEKGTEGRYEYLELSANGKTFKQGDKVVVSRGTLAFYGEVTESTDDTVCLKVQRKLLNQLSKSLMNWMSLSGYAISNTGTINLLSGESASSEISIDIICGKYIVYSKDGNETAVKLSSTMKPNRWYGIIINIGEEMEVNLFDSVPKINRITQSSAKLTREDITMSRYYTKPSSSFLTNIRLYNIANREIDKQLEDLISYNIKNNSKAIINDSADIYISNPYYGQQR